MKRYVLTCGLAALLVSGIAAQAAVIDVTGDTSDTLTADGTWYFQDQSGMAPTPTYYSDAFTAAAAGIVQVVDTYVIGDNYDIYDNGTLVASTDVPDWAADGYSSPTDVNLSDPDAAIAQGQYAYTSFGVNSGDVITIEETALPTGYTDGTVNINLTATPEPGTVALLSLGLVGVGLVRRRSFARN